MKKNHWIMLILIIVIIILAILLFRCCQSKKGLPASITVSGKIYSSSGDPLSDADAEINCVSEEGQLLNSYKLKIGNPGIFRFMADTICQANKYVVNIYKEGYSSVSKVFYNRIPSYNYTMVQSTIVNAVPTQPFAVTDTRQNCHQAFDSATMRFSIPEAKLTLVMEADGSLKAMSVPDELKPSYAKLFTAQCATGSSVRVRPNALRSPSGAGLAPEVQVNISTVNLFSPDGMPGDFTVREGRTARTMVSYGAMSIDIYSNGERLQLEKGETAEITIPIDQSMIAKDKTVADSIPFLTYQTSTGEWIQEGYARLNEQRNAYVKDVTHFSTFNLDVLKTGGSCLQINAGSLGLSPDLDPDPLVENYDNFTVTFIFQSGVTRPPYTAQNIGGIGCDDVTGNCRHFFCRLPNDEAIGVLVQDFNDAIVGNYVFYTPAGGTYGNTDITIANYGTGGRTCIPLATGGTREPVFVTPPANVSAYGIPVGAELDCNIASGLQPCLVGKPTANPDEVELSWFFNFNDATDNRVLLVQYQTTSPTTGRFVAVNEQTNASSFGTFTVGSISTATRFKVIAIESCGVGCVLPDLTADCDTDPCPASCDATFLCSNQIIISN